MQELISYVEQFLNYLSTVYNVRFMPLTNDIKFLLLIILYVVVLTPQLKSEIGYKIFFPTRIKLWVSLSVCAVRRVRVEWKPAADLFPPSIPLSLSLH